MKSKSFIMVLLLTIAAGTMANPPSGFKGVIKYKIDYTGEGITDQMKSFLPKTMTTKYRGSMTRTDMNMPMGLGKTIKLKNGTEMTVTTMFDMADQKVAMKADMDQILDELADEPDVTVDFKDEQKEILGYMCNKAIIKFTDETGSKQRLTAYYSEELGTNANHFDTKQFKDIKGILLEFQLYNSRFTMSFTATSVEKGGVSKKDFVIPDDYEMKTREEIDAIFGVM
jgi:GLPGLI family protein